MDGRPAALLFDVFGTVVDWRGSVIRAGEQVGRRQGDIDWGAFADEWRKEGYLAPIGEIFMGRREWATVEQILSDQLDVLIERHGLAALTPAERLDLLGVWRRLSPWADAVEGLIRLKAKYLIGPLSNGGFAMLTQMAKAAGLPWDCVISAEFFRAYKPSPEVYQGAARLLERAPGEVMLVAAHPGDLDAARSAGLRTAYVPRPLEWGPGPFSPDPGAERFDVVASDFMELADRL